MEKKKEWLKLGYELVAKEGFEQLSINTIARKMDKSKSSFYHYFGELENFKIELLEYHHQQAQFFCTQIKECEDINPGLIHLLLVYKLDMFFHKQVRINRNKSAYKKNIETVFELYEEVILDKWAIFLDLGYHKIFLKKFNRFMAEHFFLSITQDEYHLEWLTQYLNDIAEMISQIKNIR